MPGNHAILSPSGASRWLVCTPSARLSLQFPDSAGEAAAEGTLAHSLGEIIINYKLQRITKQKYNAEFKLIKANPLYTASMLEYCTDYAIYVLEKFAEVQAIDPKAEILIETRVDLTAFVPESFGTVDVFIFGPNTGILEVIDFKYGKGVLVEAVENVQMRIYALGVINRMFKLKTAFHFLAFKQIGLTIYQPRIDNISTWNLGGDDIGAWADGVLIPKARLAFDGKGDFVPGKHCQFCRVKTCKVRADKNMEILKYDFAKADLLTDAEVADILERHKEFTAWAGDVAEYALTQALKGKTYPGFKLVSGKSNRVISDEAAVVEGLMDAGFMENEFYTRKLLSITALETLVGKQDFKDGFSYAVTKPLGAPTLVPESDKRESLGLSRTKSDFSEDWVDPDEDNDPMLD